MATLKVAMNRYFVQYLGFSLIAYLWLIGCVPPASLSDGTRQPAGTTEVTTSFEPTTVIPATSTPMPTPTVGLTPEPTPIAMPTLWSRFLSSGALFWSAPSTWWSVREAMQSAEPEVNLIEAIASEADAFTLLSKPDPTFPNGLMLMTLRAGIEIPSTAMMEVVTVAGQNGWVQTEGYEAAAPFRVRLTLFTQIPGFPSYALSLACTPPDQATVSDEANYANLCHRLWETMVAQLAVIQIALPTECPVASPEQVAATWRQVSSQWNQYAFEVPTNWLERRGPTPDRLGFLSDPQLYNQPNFCAFQYGVMSIDFAADPPGNFGTGEPGSDPDLSGFTPTTLTNYPAWIQIVEGNELMGPGDRGTAVYIQGSEFWYYIWLNCVSPTDATTDEQTAFKMQCEGVLHHILDSFQIP